MFWRWLRLAGAFALLTSGCAGGAQHDHAAGAILDAAHAACVLVEVLEADGDGREATKLVCIGLDALRRAADNPPPAVPADKCPAAK